MPANIFNLFYTSWLISFSFMVDMLLLKLCNMCKYVSIWKGRNPKHCHLKPEKLNIAFKNILFFYVQNQGLQKRTYFFIWPISWNSICQYCENSALPLKLIEIIKCLFAFFTCSASNPEGNLGYWKLPHPLTTNLFAMLTKINQK